MFTTASTASCEFCKGRHAILLCHAMLLLRHQSQVTFDRHQCPCSKGILTSIARGLLQYHILWFPKVPASIESVTVLSACSLLGTHPWTGFLCG